MIGRNGVHPLVQFLMISLLVLHSNTGSSEDGQHAEYAIKCDDLPHPLICQRRQLSLKESEAKALRKVLQAPVPKAADLNFGMFPDL